MGFSPLADMSRRIPDIGRSSERLSAVSGFTIHHNAGVDAYGQATAAGREVGANYWITNDGTIIPHVDESRRAFTSGATGYPAGAAADHRNITVEVSNSPEGVADGTWAISEAAEDALARLIGDVYRRYSLGAVKRGADRGVGIHRDWVPTECPGGYIVANLGRIIEAAEEYRVNGSNTKRRKKMVPVYGSSSALPLALKAGVDDVIVPMKGGKVTRSRSKVAAGPCEMTHRNVQVRATGPEGAVLRVSVVRYNADGSDTVIAREHASFGSDGVARVVVPVSERLAAKQGLYVRAAASKAAKVTLLSFRGWKQA